MTNTGFRPGHKFSDSENKLTTGQLITKFLIIVLIFFFISYFTFEYLEIYPFESFINYSSINDILTKEYKNIQYKRNNTNKQLNVTNLNDNNSDNNSDNEDNMDNNENSEKDTSYNSIINNISNMISFTKNKSS